MFALEKSGAIIATDTLATAPEDGTPIYFYSKCTPVPHMNMVVAITGIAQLHVRWSARLAEGLISRDIVMADRYVPKMLATLWSELDDDGRLGDITSTVYHFGRVEESGEYVGYAYRSAHGFASERLAIDGFGIKPVPREPFTAPSALDDWVPLAERVRAEQAALPHGERIYIGGALMLTVLTDGAIIQREMQRFDDYESAWLEMNAYHFEG